MRKPSIDQVWTRIQKSEGKTFHTIEKLPFTYSVNGNSLVTSRTKRPLSKGGFSKALDLAPLDKPSQINKSDRGKGVHGTSYIWGIFYDEKNGVLKQDW